MIGYFVGKLGRSRVTCLLKKQVEQPSDMQGIVYIQFNETLEQIRPEIAKELQAAGYKIWAARSELNSRANPTKKRASCNKK